MLSGAWSFFKIPTENITLAFKAKDANVTTFVDYIVKQCALNLTATENGCDVTTPVAWGGTNACDGRNSWLSEFALETCQSLSELPEATLDCLEKATKDFLNSADQTCPSYWGWIFGGILLTTATVAAGTVALSLYLHKKEETPQEQPRVGYQSI